MSKTDISQLGTILGIWAHPDDESFLTGGILAMAADAGQKTVCVTATRGEQDGNSAHIGEIRSKELDIALGILGVSAHHFLGYQDGSCAAVDGAEAVAKLTQLIEHYKPDSIITFAPDGLTGHPDHQAVSRWAVQAASQCSVPVYFAVHTQEAYDTHLKSVDEQMNIYFATDQPVLAPESDCDIVVKLEPPYLSRKLDALQAMPSQYASWFEKLGEDTMGQALSTEALIK